ncbi:hypothetical protein Q3G72_032853 [Acer saccharum]|nr:hypothetical protein Q3G72_032853 [Acer saccharum]
MNIVGDDRRFDGRPGRLCHVTRAIARSSTHKLPTYLPPVLSLRSGFAQIATLFKWWGRENCLRNLVLDWLPGSVVFPFGVVSSLRGAVCIPFVLLAVWLFITLLFVEQIALDVSKFEKWRQRTITMFYGLMMKMMMVMVDMV